jgi:membrane AbrB-like protein
VLSRFGPGLAALALGLAGGFLFQLLGIPLAWTLGALTMAAVVAVLGGNWLMPAPLRNLVRPVLGVLAGSAFTPEVAGSMLAWWDAVVFVLLHSLLITLVGVVFFRKICRFDRITAFFASAPGGLSELTLIGASYGGHMRTLALVHSVRIITVVMVVPLVLRLANDGVASGTVAPVAASAALGVEDWLFLGGCALGGYLIGAFIRLPGGVMVGALLVSGAVHGLGMTEVVPPVWLVALVQVVIGSINGARFAGVTWAELRSTVLYALVWAVVMLLWSGLAAWLASLLLFDRSGWAMLLALAPGGTAEVILMSYALGIDVAFVVTCQITRILFVLICVPPLFPLFRGRSGSPPATTT